MSETKDKNQSVYGDHRTLTIDYLDQNHYEYPVFDYNITYRIINFFSKIYAYNLFHKRRLHTEGENPDYAPLSKNEYWKIMQDTKFTDSGIVCSYNDILRTFHGLDEMSYTYDSFVGVYENYSDDESDYMWEFFIERIALALCTQESMDELKSRINLSRKLKQKAGTGISSISDKEFYKQTYISIYEDIHEKSISDSTKEDLESLSIEEYENKHRYYIPFWSRGYSGIGNSYKRYFERDRVPYYKSKDSMWNDFQKIVIKDIMEENESNLSIEGNSSDRRES